MSLMSGLEKDFGDFQLKIPRWELADQGVTALWGPSGSGKTTVFRVMIGLEECAGFQWIWQGMDLCKLPPDERRFGVVFQTLELFPHMTARQNIEFAASCRGLGKSETQERMHDLIADLHLQDCIDRSSRVLSGGEGQRVALARAIITQPRFLFLDEPFSSLDSDHKSEARRAVKQVIEKWQTPTLLITHDADDVKALSTQVVRIKNGTLEG